MTRKPQGELRRGWTTGACATAAVKAALCGLWDGHIPDRVAIVLPKGETPDFAVVKARRGQGWAEAGVVKDAGDDPDVTHGVTVMARVTATKQGVVFKAGEGVGIVTKAGLPLEVGQAAINPVPRAMMDQEVAEAAVRFDQPPHVEITIAVPNGAQIAQKTWNPRLGIKGGLSILGTTGIVRPFSCAAWIASIHRGIDVARATGLTHVAGCTGNTSERVVQSMLELPDHGMLDMGDFAGGLLKYLAKAPEGQSIRRITIGGGIGKMTKLAQGAVDLHSGRSQVDFAALAQRYDRADVADANTALQVYELLGEEFAQDIAGRARSAAMHLLRDSGLTCATVVIDRSGTVIGRT